MPTSGSPNWAGRSGWSTMRAGRDFDRGATRSTGLRDRLRRTRVAGDTLFQSLRRPETTWSDLLALDPALGESAPAGGRDRPGDDRGQIRRLHRPPARAGRPLSPSGGETDPARPRLSRDPPASRRGPGKVSSASGRSRSARPAGSAASARPTSPHYSSSSNGAIRSVRGRLTSQDRTRKRDDASRTEPTAGKIPAVGRGISRSPNLLNPLTRCQSLACPQRLSMPPTTRRFRFTAWPEIARFIGNRQIAIHFFSPFFLA